MTTGTTNNALSQTPITHSNVTEVIKKLRKDLDGNTYEVTILKALGQPSRSDPISSLRLDESLFVWVEQPTDKHTLLCVELSDSSKADEVQRFNLHVYEPGSQKDYKAYANPVLSYITGNQVSLSFYVDSEHINLIFKKVLT